MKKAIILIAIIMLIGATSAVFAEGSATGFYTQLTFNQSTIGYADLSLTLGTWVVDYTGAITVSSTNKDATLIGNFGNYIWKYEYSVDNGANWSEIDKLITSVTAVAGTSSNVNGANGSLITVYANKLRISYDATLVSPGAYFANASGTGTLNATAVVDEPDTILASMTIIAPAAMIFRRRK